MNGNKGITAYDLKQIKADESKKRKDGTVTPVARRAKNFEELYTMQFER